MGKDLIGHKKGDHRAAFICNFNQTWSDVDL
jgi:hypothetical protein